MSRENGYKACLGYELKNRGREYPEGFRQGDWNREGHADEVLITETGSEVLTHARYDDALGA